MLVYAYVFRLSHLHMRQITRQTSASAPLQDQHLTNRPLRKNVYAYCGFLLMLFSFFAQVQKEPDSLIYNIGCKLRNSILICQSAKVIFRCVYFYFNTPCGYDLLYIRLIKHPSMNACYSFRIQYVSLGQCNGNSTISFPSATQIIPVSSV